jgi:conjugal transfer/entry exclusion protein
MKTLNRRRIFSGALVAAVLARGLTRERSAEADLWGGDLPLLAAILANSISTVSQLASMLAQVAYQVGMLKTMLSAVSSGSFTSLVDFIATARSSYSSLTSGVNSMTYTFARIDNEYQQLFPPGAPPPGTTVAQHQQQVAQWNQEVVGASQIAARQQTTLSTLDASASQTSAILQQSQSASGVVAQLQLIGQLIGITNAQLVVLNQTLATTGRVLTDMAAAGASERQLSVAKKQDSLAGYTDKGAPVVVPTQLP